jgi:hypothetical protein
MKVSREEKTVNEEMKTRKWKTCNKERENIITRNGSKTKGRK